MNNMNTANKVLACIDGLANTHGVIDWAAWAAGRLQAPLEFLHVLERHPERSDNHDFSGTIGIDAQQDLLQRLSDADAVLAKRAQEPGRQMLAQARARAEAAGAGPLDGRLRHGELAETVQELSAGAQLVVLGEHVHASHAAARKIHLDHHVEQVTRSVRCPVLVATSDHFSAPQRVVLAFDGQANARQAAQALLQQPLLEGLPVLLVMAGENTAAAQRRLDEASEALRGAGREVDSLLEPGDVHEVVPRAAQSRGPALLVMGAFGHARWRQWLLGSTTSTLLRRSGVPVLVLR